MENGARGEVGEAVNVLETWDCGLANGTVTSLRRVTEVLPVQETNPETSYVR